MGCFRNYGLSFCLLASTVLSLPNQALGGKENARQEFFENASDKAYHPSVV